MKQVVQHLKDGKTVIEEVPVPARRTSGLLVRNAYSLVSAGTERMLVELAGGSLFTKARKRPDLVRQVLTKVQTEGLRAAYEKVMNKLEMPIPLGYSSAGVVVEAYDGAGPFQPGDRVACAGLGYASHAEAIFVPRNLCAKVPDNVSLPSAAFTTVGAIALQGVRIAQVHLGDRVLVIGLGLVGQLAAQILKAAGCHVVGFDIDPWKVELAHVHSIEAVSTPSAIPTVSSLIAQKFRGFDAVLVTAATDSNAPIEMAGEWARDKGIVVVVGAVKMDVPRKLYYEKELELRLSRSYGPGRYDPLYEEGGIDYPYGYVRWTEQRNMEAFLDLLALGKVRIDSLITHSFPIAEALRAYDLITSKTLQPYLGILLDYHVEDRPAAPPEPISRVVHTAASESRPAPAGRTAPSSSPHVLPVGFIGAGNFARSVLLPNLRRLPGVRLVSVAAATGLSAKMTAQKFGFAWGTTDCEEVLGDERVHAVFIATRHDLHAPLVISALQRGRPVFVEKPLCLNESELERLVRAWRSAPSPYLLVGFNRRFAPLTRELCSFLPAGSGPLVINYRVNAGALPADSWIHKADEGGGRIIGEACHFIDFMSYVSRSQPVRLFAQALAGAGDFGETAVITVTFRDGSVGSLQYLANGDRSVPKERIEVFCRGAVAILDDFKRLTLARQGKTKVIKRFSQDKGHYGELQAFVESVRRGRPAPIPFADLVTTTRATFKILESLQSGQPVAIDPFSP